jgi:ABC-2 type transport system permease protein
MGGMIKMKLLKEIYEYRHMMAGLIKRDLRGRYKRTALGFLWTFLSPTLQMLVYYTIFPLMGRGRGIPNYPVFLFVGIITWGFFGSSLTGGTSAVLSQGGMVKKIYFPREVLPITFVTSNFIHMLYSFVIIFAAVFLSGIGINPVALLYLPLVMILEYIFALSVTLILSALTVYFRDLQNIMHTIYLLWWFSTPVFWSIETQNAGRQKLLMLNPMAPVIVAYRDILYSKKIPDMASFLQTLVVCSICLVIGILVFTKLKKHFAEEM